MLVGTETDPEVGVSRAFRDLSANSVLTLMLSLKEV